MFSALEKERPDALTMFFDVRTTGYRVLVADFAKQRRLPTIFGAREFVDAGGLMSYASDSAEAFRRTATYVDKILKGAKPADLPIEQPTKYELVVSLKTAKTIGLTIPPSVLLRADQVIEYSVLDQRGQLLRAAVGFAGLSMPSYDRALWASRLDGFTWHGNRHTFASRLAMAGADLLTILVS